ncbi:hypothetical protein H4R33_005970 [Dimargaris cristalligena]|nr:hypothetical protein H4R33_005970 [Dimargaris cristalligena]
MTLSYTDSDPYENVHPAYPLDEYDLPFGFSDMSAEDQASSSEYLASILNRKEYYAISEVGSNYKNNNWD